MPILVQEFYLALHISGTNMAKFLTLEVGRNLKLEINSAFLNYSKTCVKYDLLIISFVLAD